MKRGGKPGRSRWIISEWIDLERDEVWLTLIAVTGWVLLLILVLGN